MAEMSNLTDAASGWEGGESRAVGLCKMKLILSDWDYIKSTFKVYFILSLYLIVASYISASPSVLCFCVYIRNTLSSGDVISKKHYSRFDTQMLMFSLLFTRLFIMMLE